MSTKPRLRTVSCICLFIIVRFSSSDLRECTNAFTTTYPTICGKTSQIKRRKKKEKSQLLVPKEKVIKFCIDDDTVLLRGSRRYRDLISSSTIKDV